MAESSLLARRRRAIALVALAVLIPAAIAARQSLGIEWSVESVRGVVDRLGVWAPIGFVLLVAFRTPLLLPSQLVLTVGGLAFGVLQGALWGGLGLLLAGCISFGVARALGAERLRDRVPGGMRRALEAGGSTGGAAILAVATGYPVGPITLLHASAAITGMSFAVFLAAASIGAGIRATIFSYFGSSLIEGQWQHIALATGVLAVTLLPLAHPRVRGWAKSFFAA